MPLSKEILPKDNLEQDEKEENIEEEVKSDSDSENLSEDKEETREKESDSEQAEEKEKTEKAHQDTIIRLQKEVAVKKEDLGNHNELIRKLDEICRPNALVTGIAGTSAIGGMIDGSPRMALLGLFGLVIGGLAAYSTYKSGKLSYEQEEKKEETEKNIEELEEQITEEEQELSGDTSSIKEKD